MTDGTERTIMHLTLILGGIDVTKLDDMLEKHRQIAERIRKEKARLSKEARAADTRRKILVGAFVMSNKEQYETLLRSKAFDSYLTQNRDRKLFDLPPLPESPEEKL